MKELDVPLKTPKVKVIKAGAKELRRRSNLTKLKRVEKAAKKAAKAAKAPKAMRARDLTIL